SLKSRAISFGAVTGLALYFSLSSHAMNRHWKTEESFWQQSVKYGAYSQAHNNYGLAVSGKAPDLAEYHYREALKQNPFHIHANINLGMLYLRRGKTDEGIKVLRDIVRWSPGWALSHYWLSIGLRTIGRKAESIKEAQRAANLDPRSLEYQRTAARVLQEAGRHSEAIPYFERIIKVNPIYGLAEFRLGFALQKSGQSEKAIATYNRFLARKPKHVQGHFNLGYELMQTRDCETAVAHFNRVLELRPAYRETHLHLSKCYRMLGDGETAARHLIEYREANQE
ncbi:MAG: tetratricopeptide repeat protein, partial [Gammaproteobacteria bacterium]|nr:tetratricopeptide repeat protein [Gammaproteobacteria bacterium]